MLLIVSINLHEIEGTSAIYLLDVVYETYANVKLMLKTI